MNVARCKTLWILATITLLVAVTLVLLDGERGEQADKVERATLRFDNGAEVTVEFAVSPQERARGLSGRSSLQENTGMLFVFPHSARQGIWMPNMQFAIDVLWLDEFFRVRAIVEHMSPDTYPHAFKPDVPALYVLELPEGFVEKHGIATGSEAALIE